jgi:adenine-specific DNA methylase
MKEITSIRANNGLIDAVNDRLFSEIIIVVTEPNYQYSDGEVSRQRVTETFRFLADTKQLDTMIKALQEIEEINEKIDEGIQEGKEADHGK